MKLIYKPQKIVDGEYFHKCIDCKEVLSVSEFYHRNKLYTSTGLPMRQSHCKACTKKRSNIRRESKTLREQDKNRDRIHKYGIGTEDYNRMYIKQNKVCKICKKRRPQTRKSGIVLDLHIDHNHQTGRVRGLLCTYCNNSLGMLDETIVTFLRAILYILTDRFIYLIKRKKADGNLQTTT